MVVDDNHWSPEHYTTNRISNLFYPPVDDPRWDAEKFGWRQPDSKYRLDTVLSNGFMYYVRNALSTETTRWTVEGIELEVGDYIIIHNRHETTLSDDVDGVCISDITSADIDVIDSIEGDKIIVKNLAVTDTAVIANEMVDSAEFGQISVDLSSLHFTDVGKTAS